MVRKRSSAVFQAVGLFLFAYLGDFKGAGDEGFITLIAQFLQGNWYTKTVHEDLYIKICS